MLERVLLSLITTLGTYRENVVLRCLYNETSGNFRVVDYFEILHIHLNKNGGELSTDKQSPSQARPLRQIKSKHEVMILPSCVFRFSDP